MAEKPPTRRAPNTVRMSVSWEAHRRESNAHRGSDGDVGENLEEGVGELAACITAKV